VQQCEIQRPALHCNECGTGGVVWDPLEEEEEEDACDSEHIIVSISWLGGWPKRTSTQRDRATHSG